MKHRPHTHHRLVFDEALKRLEQSDYRLTKPRRAILEALFQQKGPFSAATLENHFQRQTKVSMDLVTIYRCLPVFADLGIIERCDFSDSVAQYEIAASEPGHHHHHVVCRECGKVEPLDFCLIEAQQSSLEKLGYRDLQHRLEFTGVCDSCQ